jgi:exonuclease VII large subunit
LAAELEKADKTIIDLETQLKNLNPTTDVGKGLLLVVEAGLKKVETAVEAEIKKLSGSFYEGDDELAKILAKLEEEKKNLSGSDELEALKKKIEEEMKKAMGGSYYADEAVEKLMIESERLRKLATDEIAKLKAEGKHALAAELEIADKTLIDLETQLKNLNPTTEVGKGLLLVVEAGLKKVETKIEDEIKKLSGSFFADDKKDVLLAESEKLKKVVADEIAKLEGEGKHVLAAELEKADKTIIDLETQLKNLNPTTDVGKGLLLVVEAGLKKVETAVEAEIKKLSGSFYEGDDELEKLKAKLEEEKKNMGADSPVIEDIRAKIEAELKKLAGGFF